MSRHRNDNTQSDLDDFAENIGMGIVKLSQTNIDGLPDRIYLDRGETFWCEIKSDTAYGKKGLTSSQKEFRDKLKHYGIEFHIIRTENDILKLKNGETK